MSVQNAPSTFGVTSPTFDWQNAPTNWLLFLTLEPWLVVLLQGCPPVALIFSAFFNKALLPVSHNICTLVYQVILVPMAGVPLQNRLIVSILIQKNDALT